MKITPQIRANEKRKRLQALRIGRTYATRLSKARQSELERVLRLAKNYPIDEWATILPKKINEKYLKKWYSDMFLGVGLPAGREAVNDFLSRKASANDIWEDTLHKWISKNGGKKVKIMTEGLKDWFRGAIKEAIKDQSDSIESMTKLLYDNVTNHYKDVAEWQIRRIVQTESLTALSVAADESVRALGIPFNKTWVISGNNTRPAHLLMDGVTIPEDEAFDVDEEQMMFPRDDSMGASAGNIINCACTCINTPK